MQEFFKKLNTISPISKDTEVLLEKVMAKKKFLKKSLYIEEGHHLKNMACLKSGILRIYSLNKNGVEINRDILVEEDIIISLSDLISKTSSQIFVECIEDCEILEVNYNEFIKITHQQKDLSKFYQIILEQLYLKQEKKNYSLLSLNATERYLELLKEKPSITQKVSQKHLASFLGITPIQLSRIRKKITEKS